MLISSGLNIFLKKLSVSLSEISLIVLHLHHVGILQKRVRSALIACGVGGTRAYVKFVLALAV